MHKTEKEVVDISQKIIREILNIRRPYPTKINDLTESEIEKNIAEHQNPKLKYFIENNLPLQFVLPAFPMKSPNKTKVLGKLPDMAEQLSLQHLDEFCQRVANIYPPGAKIIICSDGRVFGDVINVPDEDITDYQNALQVMIDTFETHHLATFNLEDSELFATFLKNKQFDSMRAHLVNHYASSLTEIKQLITASEHGLALYRAMSRFLFEDSLTPDYSGSRNALQQDAKKRAVEVIQRSWAWGHFLAEQFPYAIRFSIHPQLSTSSKIGIHMMPTKDNWLTPWHGVAVDTGEEFVLMKRNEALSLNAKLVVIDDHKSHYQISSSQANT